MVINKFYDEFYMLDMQCDWWLLEGYDLVFGVQELILFGVFDIECKCGSCMCLLCLLVGLYIQKLFVYDYWEEVFLVEGDLIVGNDEYGNGGMLFEGYMYVVCLFGVWYGLFKLNGGCVLLEIYYYDLV